MTQLSKYHGWSLLDDRPICYYDQASNTHLAVWKGIYMTRNQALLIACEKYMGIWATPTMKNRAWKEFKRAYYSGAFGHRNWDHILENVSTGPGHYSLLIRFLSKHLSEMRDYDPKDVLSWFKFYKENNDES